MPTCSSLSRMIEQVGDSVSIVHSILQSTTSSNTSDRELEQNGIRNEPPVYRKLVTKVTLTTHKRTSKKKSEVTTWLYGQLK